MQEKKVAIVTGASRGIGRAITLELAKQDVVVYALARSEQDLLTVSEEVNNTKIIPKAIDIRNTKEIKELVIEISKEQGKIDILINNAGVMQDALIGMISEEMIKELFEVNVFATIQMTQFVARVMKRKKLGSIVNVASIIGSQGNSGQSVYSSTKGAIISFTKSAAKELASSNIRVNAVAPGIIQTDLIKDIPNKVLEECIQQIKLGRIGTPEDVAKAVAFLALENAAYISGQILGVDGCAII